MQMKVTALKLDQLAGYRDNNFASSPRHRPSPSLKPLHLRKDLQSPRAVQAPSPSLSPYLLQRETPFLDEEEETDKEVINKLQQQVESIWHQYAAVRKRNWNMKEENEALQSHIHNLTKALRQEQNNNKALKKQLHHQAALAQQCQVDELL